MKSRVVLLLGDLIACMVDGMCSHLEPIFGAPRTFAVLTAHTEFVPDSRRAISKMEIRTIPVAHAPNKDNTPGYYFAVYLMCVCVCVCAFVCL